MKNQLKNIFNSYASEISMLVIVCCMIATNVSIKESGAWTDVAVVSTLVGGIVLSGLLIWATYQLIARKEVKEMPVKPRIIIESWSRILFVCWLYITVSPLFALIWVPFIIWDSVRSVRDAFKND